MRKEIILNGGWVFHKGDIAEPMSQDKASVGKKTTDVLSFLKIYLKRFFWKNFHFTIDKLCCKRYNVYKSANK